MKLENRRVLWGAAAVCVAVLSGCGSDGTGGAADLTLDITPNTIAVGQQCGVSVGLDDINDDGVTLKMKVPSELEYVSGTGILGTDDKNIAFEPSSVTTLGPDTYIVFQLPERLLRDNKAADVSFLLNGTSRVPDGQIEVDADEYDPDFNPRNPGFDSQIEESIQVGIDEG